MKRFPKNLIVIIGLVACLINLVADEITIWQDRIHIQSFALLAPLCKYLAQTFTTGDNDWRIVMAYLFAISWVLHYAIFLAAFWKCNNASTNVGENKMRVLLAMQAIAALFGDGELVLAVSPQLAYRLPVRTALWCFVMLVGARWLALAPTLLGLNEHPSYNAFDTSRALLVELRNNLFCFAMGYVAFIATRNRNRLAAANAEVLATQQLLSEAVRSSERVRIARELHDSIGHHLTALNLHLELGIRQGGASAPPSAYTARDLGQQLLANMRVAVSNERRERAIDLRQALQTLCSGIPHPHIVVVIDPDFEADTPKVAHSLFCCTQEAITNAVRHAHASTVEIMLKRNKYEIALTIEDDGLGLHSITEGNGLRGMRERIDGHIGSMKISNRPARNGCMIDIRIPLTGSNL